ncbi:MAG: OB-fold nucleic acid binding domain-containing protein, partial [Lysobacterales bacterium]
MRTHFCGLIDETLLGQSVTLCGWTDVARNLGGVCFIDLRDHEGVVQVVVEPDQAALFEVAASLGYEDVLRVVGTVRARHSVNERIRSGRVEIVASEIEILNKAGKLPFYGHENPGEDSRLKYRHLDLRRPEMQRMMRTRIKLV